MFKRAFFVMPALGFGLAALVGCSAATPAAVPVPVVTSTSSSSAAPTSSSTPVEKPQAVVEKPVVKQSECAVNPADLPVPPADPYTTLPGKYGVQIKIAGAPEVVKVGKPVEVEVTLCNNSPVAYPEVGLVFAIDRCSCAGGPVYISRGTVARFDTASGSWIDLKQPVMGTGMDYLSQFTNRQPLPKGKKVTVRYRFTFDQSMGEGDGDVVAAVVTTAGPMKISEVRAPFKVRH
ncbi:hypothetical protein ACWEIJ_26765 [Lentzea sp. NPDC004789]